MDLRTGMEIDNWIDAGGRVLAASDRAARALVARYHERRRDEGRSAWTAPAIQTWNAFVQAAWTDHAADPRMILNPAQEQALWASILARESHLATLLEGPRQRLARLAAEAHALLCSHAARYLDAITRASWDRDAAAFSRWLAAFDSDCARHRVLSAARLPLELIQFLENEPAPRPPLLLAGFDRLLPVHRMLLDAWGSWRELEPGPQAPSLQFHSIADEAAEFAACAAWCARELNANPHTRLLVLTQSLSTHRGALERALLRALPAGSFEFSLGVPLAQVPLARAAHMLLRWLSSPLTEHEIDWLLSTGLAGSADESLAIQDYQRTLRLRGLARPAWPLEAYLSQSTRVQPPATWSRRMLEAHRSLLGAQANFRTPIDWSSFALELLSSLGLPGERRSSAEHQAWQRLQSALETTASLGFDGRRIAWSDFLAQWSRVVSETLYAPESRNTAVQVAGPLEAAGLEADAIWFLGASDDNWPAPGSAHPLVPLHVQRESGMPHATAQLDWQLAEAVTTRIAASAPQVVFSFPRITGEAAAAPSRLISALAGVPIPLAAEDEAIPVPAPCTEESFDTARILYPHPGVAGGAAMLTAQSRCAFQSFAITRLGARAWEPAEFGLTAPQRGQLLHAVLHTIWAGPPLGIRSLAELRSLSDPRAFVTTHVEEAMQTSLPAGARERMPARYLELEAERLVDLISEWLAFESTRADFTVEQTESKATAAVATLTLSLRLDRIDRLADGSRAIIDYKTGAVAASAWRLPRPDDVQLPLYVAFALPSEPGALLFARLRAGDNTFAGHARDAKNTLLPALKGTSTLVRAPLTSDMLAAWRTAIIQLADDFLVGRAVVDPRKWPETCDQCGLHTLCRIRDNRSVLEDEDAADD